MKGAFDTAAIAVRFEYMSIWTALNRCELVAVFKVSYFPFLNCFASFLL